VVGKVIQFQVLYTINPPKGKPIELARILVPATGQTFPEASVADGWLKLRDNAGRNDDSDEASSLLDKLRIAENKAKSESKGVWAATGGHIEVSQDIADPKAFVEAHKDKPIDGTSLLVKT
jgi:staphylococcal nuclease domain-containing protein 1